MGGYENRRGERVQWGQVFRSDHLAELGAADWDQISELGIGLVADLRNDRERARWPSAWPDHLGVEFMMRDYDMNLRQLNEVGYHTLAYQQIELLRGFFRTLAQPDAPRVLIHCTAGQDRTGFACAFLLALLEVPLETILQDYSLSHHLRRHVAIDPEKAEELITFYGLDSSVEEMVARQSLTVAERRAQAEARMAAALDHIAVEYGSLIGFVHDELQVDGATAGEIRERLLV